MTNANQSKTGKTNKERRENGRKEVEEGSAFALRRIAILVISSHTKKGPIVFQGSGSVDDFLDRTHSINTKCLQDGEWEGRKSRRLWVNLIKSLKDFSHGRSLWHLASPSPSMRLRPRLSSCSGGYLPSLSWCFGLGFAGFCSPSIQDVSGMER